MQFVSFVLDDAERTWTEILPAQADRRYRDAKLVLFRDTVDSGCGYGQSAMGPFYCPVDERAYIDLGFYRELRSRFGAAGDFAQAYVLAHEIGHHVQNVLDTDERAHRELQLRSAAEKREVRVRLELQADCFAGIWAHSAGRRDLLEMGDVEKALAAAAAVGDDRIRQQSSGRVNPETWAHGSSEMRTRWFVRGMETGKLSDCDTIVTDVL